MTSSRALLDHAMSEKEFQAAVVGLARLRGWLVYHTLRSEGSAAGYPDLTLVRPPRVVFIELKPQKGRPSAEQRHWLMLLEQCPGVEVHLFRPSEWDELVEVLT